MVGMAIVYPIFLPVLLSSEAHFFEPGVLESAKVTAASFLLMSYPLMQFLSAPLLGAISDRLGRFPVLLASVAGLVVSYALCAFALQAELLIWLFVGRAIGGVFSGNISLCLSAIADIIPQDKRRSKYFGYVSFLSGLAWIIGPFLGGVMSEGSWGFSPATPFWIIAFLALIDFIVTFMLFKETLKNPEKSRFSLWGGVRDIFEACTRPKLRRLFLFYFFFLCSMEVVFLFLSGFLRVRYDLSMLEIGLFFAYTGIVWSVGTSYLNTLLLKWGSLSKIILLTVFVAALGQLLLVSYVDFLFFSGCVGLLSLAFSILWPNTYAIISVNAPAAIQGKVMGISGSMSAVAAIFASYIGGLWFRDSAHMLFIGSFGFMVAAALVFFWDMRKTVKGKKA